MPEIEIRPVVATDIETLAALEHNYTSDHVWQMNFRSEGNTVEITFREARLPRSVQVQYPNNPQHLLTSWTMLDGLLVAELENQPVGYIGLTMNPLLGAVRVTDLAVARRLRRQKIGSSLVLAGQDWAMYHEMQRLLLEVQPKNYPAIQMAQKLGFELCGYNDHYFANQDIALFFSKWMK